MEVHTRFQIETNFQKHGLATLIFGELLQQELLQFYDTGTVMHLLTRATTYFLVQQLNDWHSSGNQNLYHLHLVKVCSESIIWAFGWWHSYWSVISFEKARLVVGQVWLTLLIRITIDMYCVWYLFRCTHFTKICSKMYLLHYENGWGVITDPCFNFNGGLVKLRWI